MSSEIPEKLSVHSVHFRNTEGAGGGELYLGGTNPAHYEGELNYVQSLDEATYWMIKMNR